MKMKFRMLVVTCLLLALVGCGGDPGGAVDGGAPPRDALSHVDAAAPEPIAGAFEIGQSNGDGAGNVLELPVRYHPPFADIPFAWSRLTRGTASDGWEVMDGQRTLPTSAPKWFGPELTWSRGMVDAGHPVAVVKFTKGGTSLNDAWLPSANYLYPQALAYLREQLASFGSPLRVRWVIWMQGEGDCNTLEMALAYRANLQVLIAQLRVDLDEPDLIILVGRLNDGMDRPYLTELQASQDAVGAADPLVAIIPTDDLPLNDQDPPGPLGNVHYGTVGQVALGERMVAPAIALLH